MLTDRERLVFEFIRNSGGQRRWKDLEEEFCKKRQIMSPDTLSNTLKNLELNGVIERIPDISTRPPTVWYTIVAKKAKESVTKEFVKTSPIDNYTIISTLSGRLEEVLKGFVARVLETHIGKDWEAKCIPGPLIADLKKIRTKKVNVKEAKESEPLINFADLGHIWGIITKNWHIFKNYYRRSLEWFNDLMGSLKSIRDKAVHRRPGCAVTDFDVVTFQAHSLMLLIEEKEKNEFKELINSLKYPVHVRKQLFTDVKEYVARNVRFPRKEDFENKLVYLDLSNFEAIRQLLFSKRFCLLIGVPASRKTTLSLHLGLELMEQGYVAYYFEIKEELPVSVDELLEEIKISDHDKSIFIIDDCHKAIQKAYELIYRAMKETKKAKFLFLSRKITKIDPEYDYFKLFSVQENGKVLTLAMELKPDETVFKGIIEQFFVAKGIHDYYRDYIGDIKRIIDFCGRDVFLLNTLLETWFDTLSKERKIEILSDTTKEKFYSKISEKYNLRENKDLLKICAIYQYEIPVSYGFLVTEGVSETKIKEWLANGLINLVEGAQIECYTMTHSSFAKTLLEVGWHRGYLFVEGLKPLERTLESFTSEILKRFLFTLEPSKWFNIFHKIFSQRDSCSKKILAYLWSDESIWSVFKEHVKNLSLGSVISLIEILLWLDETTKLSKSSKAREIQYIYFKHNYKKLQEKMKLSSATSFTKYLRLLTRIKHLINVEKFFAEFSISALAEIIKRSTILGIRILTFNLLQLSEKEPALLNLANNVAKAVVSLSNEELSQLIATTSSLYRLGGLIGNMQQIDEVLALKFVERLSQIDLNQMFSRDSFAEKIGFSTLRSINFFLSYRLKFAPDYRNRIINNLDDNIISLHIQSGAADEVMWLLWNIFRDKQTKARQLVQNNEQYITKKIYESKDSPYYLPFLGILFILAFDIDKFPAPSLSQINQSIHYFKEFGPKKLPSATALVLSLLFLKIKIDQSQYYEFGKILKEELVHRSIYSHFDPQAREVLINLIQAYQL